MLSRRDTKQKGEVALRDEATVLYETRAYRVGGGAGTRIGRMRRSHTSAGVGSTLVA
jgi:hypothetical protein